MELKFLPVFVIINYKLFEKRTLLLEIGTKVEEVQSFPCEGYVNDTCVYTLSSTFL